MVLDSLGLPAPRKNESGRGAGRDELEFGGSDGARVLIRGRVETANQNARIASRGIPTHDLPPVNPSGLLWSSAQPSEAGLQFDLFFFFLYLINELINRCELLKKACCEVTCKNIYELKKLAKTFTSSKKLAKTFNLYTTIHFYL